MELANLVKSIQQIPPTPQILPKLKQLLHDGDSSVNDVLALIKVDPSLAAQIVKVSNSAFYGASSPSHNLEEAVNRIGFNEVYKLVAFIAASHVLGHRFQIYDMGPNELFKESITNAVIMQMISQTTGEDSDTAYTIGLLHSIGKVVLNQYCLDSDLTIKPGQDGIISYKEERDQLGFHNAEAGAAILNDWQFHNDVSRPIEAQFAPQTTAAHRTLTYMLVVSKTLAPHIHIAPQEIPNVIDIDDETLDIIRINKEELTSCVMMAKAALHDIHDLIESI